MEPMIEVVGVIATCVMGLAWLFRLEARISSHEMVCSERQRHLTERHDETLRRISVVDEKLDRILSK